MYEPKIAFCQKELIADHLKAIKDLELDTRLVCFDDGEFSMKKFIQEYDDDDEEEFIPATFDLDEVYACLISSSGTTGAVKQVAFKHREWLTKLIQLRDVCEDLTSSKDQNSPTLHLAPVQWFSALLNALAMPLLHLIKIQTSGPNTTDHIIDIINKYKPVSVIMTSTLLYSIFEDDKPCDFTCFDTVMIGGTSLPKDLHEELQIKMRADAHVIETYGQTENMGSVFMPVPNLPHGCCGNGTNSWHELKLIDTKTGAEITEPNVPGELLTKGLCLFVSS